MRFVRDAGLAGALESAREPKGNRISLYYATLRS
jgi:hypothetical protein